MIQEYKKSVSKWSIQSDLASSYLVYTLSGNEIETFKLKMIQRNSLGKLLNIQYINEGNKHNLFYNTTGLINFIEYINLHKIHYNLLVELINEIINVVKEGQDYLLSENGFLLEGDKIFIKTDTEEIKFIYLPCKNISWDNRSQIEKLIQIMMPYIHKQDEKAIALAHQLRMLLEDKHSHICEMEKILYYNVPKTDIVTSINSMQILPSLDSNHVDSKDFPQQSKSKDSIMTFIILQSFIVIMIFLCIPQWIVIQDDHSTRLLKIICMIGLVGISEFIIFSKVLVHKEKVKVDKVEVKNHIMNEESNYNKEVVRLNSPTHKKNIDKSKKVVLSKLPRNNTPKRVKWHWDEEDYSMMDSTFDDMSFDEETKRAYIVDSQGIHTPITKTPFIIGKMKSIVDFSINNELISRVHCQIISEGEFYYLIDLESTNGTVLNKERLEGHKKYPLKDLDEISITSVNYVFKCF